VKPGRGNKTPPPRETEKGLIPRADRRARTCSLAEPVVLTRHASAPRAVRSLAGSATLDKPLIRECLFYPTYEPLAMLLGSGLCVARTPRLPRIQTLICANCAITGYCPSLIVALAFRPAFADLKVGATPKLGHY